LSFLIRLFAIQLFTVIQQGQQEGEGGSGKMGSLQEKEKGEGRVRESIQEADKVRVSM
jgi:hypothetical protein